jgi:hypothetical protein
MLSDALITSIDQLSREDSLSLLVVLAAKLAAPSPTAPEPSATPDELLTVQQVAPLLGKSAGWLYHNHHKLPFRISGIGKTPRFSRHGLELYLVKHQRDR